MVPSGTVTFVFTDVEGSTRLWVADPAGMAASLRLHDEAVRAALEAHAGYVFSTAGDSFAAAFTRASDGVAAALAVQQALRAAVWPGPALRVRIGVHAGEADERLGDYFGPAVSAASRIATAAHGGQIVVSTAVRELAAVDGEDLGVHQLRDLPAPMRLWQIGAGEFPPLRVAASMPATNLPGLTTRLFGRSGEVAEVRRLLVTDRLVTITGPGGAGKTRLALTVAAEELSHRSGGIWFADLAAVMSDADVTSAVAAGLGMQLTVGDATEQLVRFLADREALVVLDNCEHLVEGCAELAEAFLAHPGRSVLLATSRQAMGVPGERIVVLGPLGCGSVESPAVQLFVDRAVATDPSFALTDTNKTAVAALCAGLDGLPLAIELAAARVSVMTPAELLAGLEARFRLLAGGRRRARHRTLQATLDWSYQLLDAEEQRVLRALGVFLGTFDLDAAATVTDLDRFAAADVVESLVQKSLVMRAPATDVSRFTLLETVKAYAEDRLADAGEATLVRDRHLAHFHRAAMAGGVTPHPDLQVGERLEPDVGNVAAAFEWAAATDRWAEAAELVHGAVDAFVLQRRHLEVGALLARGLRHTDDDDPTLAGYLRSDLLLAAVAADDYHAAIGWAHDLAASTAPCCQALGLSHLGFLWAVTDVEQARARQQRARTALAACEQRTERTGAPLVALAIDTHEVSIAGFDGDDTTTAQLAASLVATAAGLEQIDRGVATATVVGAAALLNLDRPDEALAMLEALSTRREAFSQSDLRAVASLALGHVEAATGLIRDHAKRGRSAVLRREASDSVLLLAALADAEGDRGRAIELLLGTGLCRNVGFIVLARGMARRFGVAGEYHEHERRWLDPNNTNAYGLLGADVGMATLVDEMSRRGWT